MTDRPIIFSAPMVRALLSGRKSMTRRVLTRLSRVGAVTEFGPSDTPGYDWHFRDREKRWHDLRDAEMKARLPYAVGDRLWVKEQFAIGVDADEEEATDPYAWLDRFMLYPAGGDGPEYIVPDHYAWPRRTKLYTHATGTDEAWTEAGPISGRFMPRWASRLTLIITEIRVERLNDISDADAVSEGIYARGTVGDDPAADVWAWQREGWRYPTPREAFKALWAEIHGSDAWAANPWVVAISFRPILANIDAHPKAGGLQDEKDPSGRVPAPPSPGSRAYAPSRCASRPAASIPSRGGSAP